MWYGVNPIMQGAMKAAITQAPLSSLNWCGEG